jgi:mannose-6-phosphate isomerase-like protein (cupin superfamily)
MSISKDVLAEISSNVLAEIRAMSAEEFRTVLVHQEYHDFGKDDFTAGFIFDILNAAGLTKKDVQIDIISVERDLTHQIHYHKDAHAFIVILGEREHVPASTTAEAYIDGRWFPVSAGQVLSIPPGTHHGFRVQNNVADILRFLSVQSPPITREDEDDYHQVPVS